MKRPLLLLAVILAALAFAGLAFVAPSASADGPIVITGDDTGASAGFFNVDAAGEETSVSIFANDFTFTDPFGTFAGSFACVDIFQFDPGNPRNPRDDKFHAFFGCDSDLAPSQFQVFGNLNSAALDALVNVCEFVDGPGPPGPNCFEVNVDLDWTGTGDISTSSGRSSFRFDGCRVQSTFTNSFRSADVAGSVVGNTTDFTGGSAGSGNIFTSSFQDRLFGDCFFGAGSLPPSLTGGAAMP